MQIPIKNYLLELDDKKYVRKGSDNIRVYGIGGIIKRLYLDLQRFYSIEQIERRTGRIRDSYENWIRGKTGIAVQRLYKLCKYWKATCRKSKQELNELWEEIYREVKYFGCTNGKQIKLPKNLDYNLAYLLGVIIGDGHLADPNKSYDKFTTYNSELRITDGYKETFISLSRIFEELFDYKPKIYSEKSKIGKEFYRFVIRSKPLHRFLMKVCGIPTGKKFDKVDILSIIKNSPLEIQKAFITGFFDADGCIRLAQGKYPEVSISQLNPRILYSIINVSKRIGIKWNGPYRTDCQRNHSSTIKISNRENVERFLNSFPSFNPIKIKQGEIIWKKIKSQPTSQFKWMEIEDGAEKIKETL